MACERPFSHFLREENRVIEEKKRKKTVNVTEVSSLSLPNIILHKGFI